MPSLQHSFRFSAPAQAQWALPPVWRCQLYPTACADTMPSPQCVTPTVSQACFTPSPLSTASVRKKKNKTKKSFKKRKKKERKKKGHLCCSLCGLWFAPNKTIGHSNISKTALTLVTCPLYTNPISGIAGTGVQKSHCCVGIVEPSLHALPPHTPYPAWCSHTITKGLICAGSRTLKYRWKRFQKVIRVEKDPESYFLPRAFCAACKAAPLLLLCHPLRAAGQSRAAVTLGQRSVGLISLSFAHVWQVGQEH